MHTTSIATPNLKPINNIYINGVKIILYHLNPFLVQIETGEIFSRTETKNKLIEIICNGDNKKYVRKHVTEKHLTCEYISNAFRNKYNNPFKGKKHSNEFKKRLSRERKGTWCVGEKNTMFGKKFRDVIIEKYGDNAEQKLKEHSIKSTNFGEKNGMFGKTHSEKTRQTLREKNKNLFDPIHWIEKGYSKEEAIFKIEKWKKNHLDNVFSKENILKKYGYDSDKIYEKFRESRRQTLEKFINLYGDVDGTRRYSEYIEKLRANLYEISNKGWSKISQNLFHFIYNNLKNEYKDLKFHFATLHNGILDFTKNKEYRVDYLDNNHKKRWFRLDFYIEEINFSIEYDCKLWHNKENDKKRLDLIKQLIPNIKILHVNHEEYIKVKKRNIIQSTIIQNIKNEIDTHYNSQKNQISNSACL